jgi:hypothetical protein
MPGVALRSIREVTLSPTHSDDQKTTLFASDRRFKLWRYGVGHSQLLLRSVPSAGQRCLDINFERVAWMSLPTAMSMIEIVLADGGDLNLPAGVSGLIDERSPLLLKISAQGISGLIICAGAEAAYTAWSPTVADSESGEDETIWSLRKN